jgi:hypothetical protein
MSHPADPGPTQPGGGREDDLHATTPQAVPHDPATTAVPRDPSHPSDPLDGAPSPGPQPGSTDGHPETDPPVR